MQDYVAMTPRHHMQIDIHHHRHGCMEVTISMELNGIKILIFNLEQISNFFRSVEGSVLPCM